MKTIFLAILLLAFAGAGSAQNTIKLFDPTPISWSDPIVMTNAFPYGMFKTAQVYLNCPASGRLASTISGPNGGDLIVDNFMRSTTRTSVTEIALMPLSILSHTSACRSRWDTKVSVRSA